MNALRRDLQRLEAMLHVYQGEPIPSRAQHPLRLAMIAVENHFPQRVYVNSETKEKRTQHPLIPNGGKYWCALLRYSRSDNVERAIAMRDQLAFSVRAQIELLRCIESPGRIMAGWDANVPYEYPDDVAEEDGSE